MNLILINFYYELVTSVSYNLIIEYRKSDDAILFENIFNFTV